MWGCWNTLPSGTYFSLGELKHFASWGIEISHSKIYKDFELYQVFILIGLNILKHFDEKNQTKFSVPKNFNISILYTTDV